MNTKKLVVVFAILLAVALFSMTVRRAPGQSTYSQPRITAAVNDSQLTVLRGNVYPLARTEFDRGLAPASLPMQHMLMVLKRSSAQEAALESFMAQQLDRSSANYHHWLTPTEFGQMYGPAQQDIDTITKWLAMHGFQVNNVANGRTTIDFSGNAGQVQAAFHTAIHQYAIKGEQHWANSTDPSIPTALAPVVAGVRSLNNFYPKPQSMVRRASSVRPNYTFDAGGCDPFGTSADCFVVGANDFATIYNVQTLWNSGIDGTGETIAIVGDSNINPTDVSQFRSLFGLPNNVPNIIEPDGNVSVGGPNSDEIEAALDTEWSGAVAKNAKIDLVIAPDCNGNNCPDGLTFGGDIAANYVVNCHTNGSPNCGAGIIPANVLSESFGACEYALGTTGNAFYNTTWQQAAAEGITVAVASGDQAAAACDLPSPASPPGCGFSGSATLQTARCGLAVNGIASTPYDVAVGGTDFNDFGTESLYWNTTPGQTSSALKYVPEDVWNDSCTNSILFNLVSVTPPITSAVQSCSDTFIQQGDLVIVAGSGGGESNCTTSNGTAISSCAGGYAKPAWQNTAGTPGTTRDLPDVSLFAGDGLFDHFYVMCEMDQPIQNGIVATGQNNQPCVLGTAPNFVGVGGTSVAVQAFGGIMALVDQKNGNPGVNQGNAGPTLYALAATQSNANCNASTPAANCIFNDVTVGTNSTPCTPNSTDCTTAASIPGAPAVPASRINVEAVRIACALAIGALLLFGLRRKQRRWATAAATCGAIVLLVISVGCGGSNDGGGGSTGNGQGTPEGVLRGYNAGVGYDLATGLGSINAGNLVNAPGWAAAPVEPPSAIQLPGGMAPAAALAAVCALLLATMFVGLRRRQMRWSTVVLLLAFALSILSAARSYAGTRAAVRSARDSFTKVAALRR